MTGMAKRFSRQAFQVRNKKTQLRREAATDSVAIPWKYLTSSLVQRIHSPSLSTVSNLSLI